MTKVPKGVARLRHEIFLMKMALTRVMHRTAKFTDGLSTGLLILSAIASVVCLVSLVIHAGYDHTDEEIIAIRRILRMVQGIFLCNVLFNFIFRFRETLRDTKLVKWVVDIAMFVTLLPWIYPHPANPWIPWLEQILYSNKLLYTVMTAYSIVTLSYALFKTVGRRTNPSLLMSGSFLVFIMIGSFLLMLPKCTYHDISYVDSLFVSTSAVSITGLTPVDVPSTFTPMGILVLAVLIQIGALGVMTFTSFFALFFSGNASIYSQLMLKDMVYSKSMSSLVPTLLYIMGFTFAIEIFGAVLIFLSIHGTLGLTVPQELAVAGFHSISAFCNAGFSNLPGGMANPMLMGGNSSIYWIMTLLIVAGSMGFPILVNFRDAMSVKLRNLRSLISHRHHGITAKQVHIFNMNTKIVIVTFGILFIAGALIFFILEYNNSLVGMTLWEKITQSVFNSASPRSAGFISVNPAGFMNVTLLIIMFLMWIGGASQSTGGGIKVNTFAAICLNLRAILTGNPKVTAYRRTISTGSIRRANAVVFLSIISYLIISVILIGLEPALPVRELLFESLSALFTVGSSLGVTAELNDASKVLLSTAMFLGRVGLISLLTGLVRHSRNHGVTFPSDNIIIN